MPTLIHKRVALARAGELPQVVARVKSGWVVMGDVQMVRGYCLLLPDPVVSNLNALVGDERSQFLRDMTTIGDHLLAITGAARINYEMLGNLEPALHAHIFPRYASEPAELKMRPIWFYDWNSAPPFDLKRDEPLMVELRQLLQRCL